MTRDRQDKSGQRDTTMARLVAAALESGTAAPAGDVCPDAGLLAAYADQTLSANETARWESHFADCARCQEVLAILTISAEDPLTQREAARLGQSVGKTASPNRLTAPVPQVGKEIARPQIVRPTQNRPPWRWLVPAFGVAAAVAMWFALRPTPPSVAPGSQVMMAEKTGVPPAPGQQEQIQASAPPRPAAPLPAKPSAVGNSRPPALAQEKEAQNLDREIFSSAANAPAKQKGALRDEASNEARSSVAPEQDKKAVSGAPVAEADGTAPAAPPAPVQQTQAVTVTGAAPAVTAGNAGALGGAAAAATPSAALQAQAARQAPMAQPAPPTGSQLSADNALKAVPLASRNAAMAKVAAAPIVFATPDRVVEWRISAGGRIERSTDQGKTWQSQSSGVTSDLLAGSAVSDKIAWIVGRADTILRTTDGEHWLRATAPPVPPASGAAAGRVDAFISIEDLTGVQASDALHATITSAAGRRYATTNGGLTWLPQP